MLPVNRGNLHSWLNREQRRQESEPESESVLVLLVLVPQVSKQ